MPNGDRNLAVFIDFENLALGFHNRRDRFEIDLVIERLVEKGKIVAKKAYCDWSRFGIYTGPLHEAAIELIEIPRRNLTGKNSADIRLCVDAMDLAYSKEHIDTFVIVSGDSDFSPLVSKLKELGKHVIGLGMQDSTSELLRDNCDEFIYYEDLLRGPVLTPALTEQLPEAKRKAFALLMESLLALRRENKEVLWSSMIKDTMKRKKPSFNETYHGYRTFSDLLQDAEREGLLELDTDKRSKTYVVTRFGDEMKAAPADIDGTTVDVPNGEGATTPVVNGGAPPADGLPVKKKSSRRRRSSGKRRKNGLGAHPPVPLEPGVVDVRDEATTAEPERPPAEDTELIEPIEPLSGPLPEVPVSPSLPPHLEAILEFPPPDEPPQAPPTPRRASRRSPAASPPPPRTREPRTRTPATPKVQAPPARIEPPAPPPAPPVRIEPDLDPDIFFPRN